MDRDDIIKLAREAGGLIYEVDWCFEMENLERFFQTAYAAGVKAESDRIADEAKHIIKRAEERGAAAERERICKAIKEEDDYCVTEGDYMLDSNDCIAVAKSEWVRPDYSEGAIRARGDR